MRSATSLGVSAAFLSVVLLGCQNELGRFALAGEAVASDDTAVDGPRVRRVWSDAGDYSSVSPDGRLVTFVDWSTGDVAVHDLATGENRRITDKGTWSENGSWAEEPIFSSDGRQVAFMYGDVQAGAEPFTYQLRVVGVDGSGERIVRDFNGYNWGGWPMDWSARHGILVELYEGRREPALAVISPESGEVRVLRQFMELRPHPHDGRFSPDGRFVAYKFGGDVRVLAADGSDDHSLGLQSADAVLGWAPDGAGILIHARREGASGVWNVPVRGGQRAGEPSLVKGGLPAVREAGYTSDGFYYVVPVDAPKLYLTSVDLESGRVLAEPRALTSAIDGMAMAPAWSPDGSRLAYVLRGQEGRYRVMVRAAEGDEVRELTEIAPAQDVFNPTWTPDGSALYLQVRVPQVTSASLRRIDIATGEMEEVARFDAGLVMPTADASSVVLFREARDGSTRPAGLIFRDVASGRERVLAEIQGTRSFSISPDGESVAVAASLDNRTTALMIVPLDGGEPRILDRATSPEHVETNQFSLPWTADGRYVLVARAKGGSHRLMAYPVDGGEPTPLLEVKDNREYPAIHPDGRRLIFQDGEPRQELWVLDRIEGMH